MSGNPFNFDDDTLADIIYENPEGWTTVKAETIDGQSRWHTQFSRVISDGTNYCRISYSQGSTEYQDSDDNADMTQVYPHEVMTTIYTTEKPA